MLKCIIMDNYMFYSISFFILYAGDMLYTYDMEN